MIIVIAFLNILFLTFLSLFTFFWLKKNKNQLSQNSEQQKNDDKKYIDLLQKQIELQRKQYKESLKKLSGYDFYEIEKEITKDLKIDLENYKNEKILEFDHQISQHKNEIAKTIILNAIETNCLKVTNDTSTNFILLKDENIKPKFIGKKGRNINFFKQITGTDVIIEKEPYIVVSCSNPIKKQIAINVINHMISSNAFDENAIINIYKKEKNKIVFSLNEIGKEYVKKLSFQHINPNLFYYIGKLQYRSSYSQNVLEHCYECGIIAKKIAKQLKLNEELAAMCGFFHDIGKSVDYDLDYDHIKQGVELAKKYHLPKEVIQAIQHHHDHVFLDTYVILTKIADTISAGRKGARTINDINFKQAKIAESICKKNFFVKDIYTLGGSDVNGNFLKIIITLKKNCNHKFKEIEFDLMNLLSKNKNLNDLKIEILFNNIVEK